MSLLCSIVGHKWLGCKCARCSNTRDEDHKWDGCKCPWCGKTRDKRHNWSGCKCSSCGITRDEEHDWSYNCELCWRCDKTREEGHDWSKYGNTCARCGRSKTPLDFSLSANNKGGVGDLLRGAAAGNFQTREGAPRSVDLQMAAGDCALLLTAAYAWGERNGFGATWMEDSPQYKEIRRLGEAINASAGLEGMKTVIQLVRLSYRHGYMLDHFWDRIGRWFA